MSANQESTLDRAGPQAGPVPPRAPVGMIALGALALLLLVALIAVLFFWGDDGAVDPEQATVGEITDNPQEFIGENVIVSGEVNRILTPFSYVIGGEQFVGGGEMLIIGPPPAAIATPLPGDAIYPQDIVQVSGEVREFDRTEIEQEMEIELPQDMFDEYSGQPVIVGGATTLTSRVRAAGGEVTDIDDILESPDDYYGETVNVTADISRVFNERLFVIGDGLLIVDETGVVAEAALSEGVRVQAGGMIQRFDQANVEGEAGDQDLSEFEGNPVLLAEVLQIVEASQ